MMNKLFYKNNKNLFLHVYVLASVIVILLKMVFAIIDGDILLDTFLIYLRSMIYGSYSFIQHYLTIEFRAVGPLAIFLILHFGLYFRNSIIGFFKGSKYNVALSIVLPIFGVLFYCVLRIVLEVNAPFSLMEGISFALITYPLILLKNIKINEKLFEILLGIFVIIVFVFGIIFMFME